MNAFRARPPTETPGLPTETSNSQSGGGGGRRQESRYGEPKIRRLADSVNPEDEDDQATYNGNSTQQQ